jgi:hypothetical protein
MKKTVWDEITEEEIQREVEGRKKFDLDAEAYKRIRRKLAEQVSAVISAENRLLQMREFLFELTQKRLKENKRMLMNTLFDAVLSELVEAGMIEKKDAIKIKFSVNETLHKDTAKEADEIIKAADLACDRMADKMADDMADKMADDMAKKRKGNRK